MLFYNTDVSILEILFRNAINIIIIIFVVALVICSCTLAYNKERVCALIPLFFSMFLLFALYSDVDIILSNKNIATNYISHKIDGLNCLVGYKDGDTIKTEVLTIKGEKDIEQPTFDCFSRELYIPICEDI